MDICTLGFYPYRFYYIYRNIISMNASFNPNLPSEDFSMTWNGQQTVVFGYWPFQGGTSFVDLLCFCSVLCLLCFVRVCLYVLCGHLLGKGWPLGSRLWCILWVCHFPIGILGQVWYLIVSIPDLCTLTYFVYLANIIGHRIHRDHPSMHPCTIVRKFKSFFL